MLGEGTTTVIGDSARLSPAGAALVNAYRITALTACDVYTPAHFHVTPEIVPPAFAVAERMNATGSDLLVALAAGLEVATRIAAGLNYPAFRARGWHAPGVVGPFGGAVAVGSLLRLPPKSMRNALGLAGSQSAGTWAAWGTPTVKFHQARAAISGLLAGTLAETGFAASDDILGNPDGGILHAYSDGGEPERITADLGSHWELERISLRPWPGATPLQPVISALMRLIDDGRLRAPSYVPVRIHVAPSVVDQHARFSDPTGTFEAMLSIHYATAAILTTGRLGFREFLPAAYGRREIREQMRQVELIPDPDLTPLQCRVEVGDPAFATESVDVPKGHPDDPASRSLLAAKFRACADPVLGTGQATELLATIEGLAGLEATRDLFRLLASAP
jgi:2-methylcitrate dehydratase PrpD